LSWQLAAILAAGLFCVAGFARLPRAPRLTAAAPFAGEAGLVVALYALWQYAGSFSVMGTGGAIGRAQWIWNIERAWHLPSEAILQKLALPYPLIVEAFNIYYATMHFTALVIFLVWLYARHRAQYQRIRAILVIFTAASLLMQLVPVAPPRMLAGIGLVDTAQIYGQSVYAIGGGMADQFSAMPSVHMGWALLIAFAVWRVTASRGRWVAVAHAVLTWVVVVVTANHFWLDGLVAAGLLVVALVVAAAGSAAAAAVRSQAAALHPDLAPAETSADKMSASADVRSMRVR